MQTLKLSQIKKNLLSNVSDRLFFAAIVVLTALVLYIFWQKQQENVDSFDQQITELNQKINALPITSVPKKQLAQKIINLQKQTDALSLVTISKPKDQKIKSQIRQQLVVLEQQVNSLPNIVDKEKLSLVKDRLTLKKDQVNLQNAIYVSLIQALGTLFFLVTAYFAWRNVKIAEENLKAIQEKQEADRLNAEANLKIAQEKQETDRLNAEANLKIIQEKQETDRLNAEANLRIAQEKQEADRLNAEANLKITQEKQITDRLNAEANLKATEEKQITERFSKAIELLGHKDLEVRIGGIYALERIAKDSTKDHWTIVEVLTSFIRSKSPLQESMPAHSQNSSDSSSGAAQLYGQQPIPLDVKAALTVIGRRETDQDPLDDDRTINLSGCNFCGFSLKNARFGRARLNDVYWGEVFLEKANFEKANLCLTNLRKATLTGAIFREAWLTQANLDFATLAEADLSGAEIAGAKLHHANFKKANLAKANFFQANLASADLREADLSDADLTDAILTGAKLAGADLSGADFTRAVGVSREEFNQATVDDRTKPPSSWQLPETEQSQQLNPE